MVGGFHRREDALAVDHGRVGLAVGQSIDVLSRVICRSGAELRAELFHHLLDDGGGVGVVVKVVMVGIQIPLHHVVDFTILGWRLLHKPVISFQSGVWAWSCNFPYLTMVMKSEALKLGSEEK